MYKTAYGVLAPLFASMTEMARIPCIPGHFLSPSHPSPQKLSTIVRRIALIVSLSTLLPLSASAAIPEFDVHFVVATAKFQGDDGVKGADGLRRRPEKVEERLRDHIERLNADFRSENGPPLARFRFKSVAFFPAAASACPDLVKAASLPTEKVSVLLAKIKDCRNPVARDPKAVNVYIYSPEAPGGGDGHSFLSRGRSLADGPVVLLHWKSYHKPLIFWHEMGHAFGLPHVCSTPRPEGTHWNIMATPDACKQKGRMSHGFHFDADQSATVSKRALHYLELFGTR